MRTLNGDLLDQPAFGHGCNIAGSMGGGVARQVRDRYPDLHDEYLDRCREGRFPLGSAWAWTSESGQVVYNLATQVHPGPDARLETVRSSVTDLLREAAQRGVDEVGLPRLGAGIGGLEWHDVLAVLEELDAASPVGLVVVERSVRPAARTPRRG